MSMIKLVGKGLPASIVMVQTFGVTVQAILATSSTSLGIVEVKVTLVKFKVTSEQSCL
jgi:hypothetical protein